MARKAAAIPSHVRAWNSPAPAGRFCDGLPVPTGFEGVHVFDVSNTSDPALVAAVDLECGSHTLTAAGVVDGSLTVYSNNSSSIGCIDGTRANDDPAGDFMDIITIPLAAPGSASLLRREPLRGRRRTSAPAATTPGSFSAR